MRLARPIPARYNACSQPAQSKEETVMKHWSRVRAWSTCALGVAMSIGLAAQQRDLKKNGDSDPKPKLSLKAQPTMAIAPARIVFSAELAGGANDYQEYYCPSVEWDWGDETRSESTLDCEPYEAGKSEIKRHYTIEHVYKHGGRYRVFFRLKRRDKSLGQASTSVDVRPGLRDIGGSQ
jgi:hypothetical protein